MTRAFVPTSLDEALRLLADRELDACPIAGCTDLMVRGATIPTPPPVVCDLTRLPELRGISHSTDGIDLGAAVTFAEIERDVELRRRIPILAEAAETIGGVQIRNRATLGGNVANASPVGDSAPVLLALDAVVVIAGPGGERRVPYAEMHTGYRRTALRPGELITRLHIPMPPPGTVQHFRKVGTRAAQAISKVVVALAMRSARGELYHVRVAAGAVAATPVRLGVVEKYLEGNVPCTASAERAGELARESVTPLDDVRSTARYRSYVLGRIVRRMVLEGG